jgi:hypothetical protein
MKGGDFRDPQNRQIRLGIHPAPLQGGGPARSVGSGAGLADLSG